MNNTYSDNSNSKRESTQDSIQQGERSFSQQEIVEESERVGSQGAGASIEQGRWDQKPPTSEGYYWQIYRPFDDGPWGKPCVVEVVYQDGYLLDTSWRDANDPLRITPRELDEYGYPMQLWWTIPVTGPAAPVEPGSETKQAAISEPQPVPTNKEPTSPIVAERELKNHRLRTWPGYFQDVKDGRKPFELRLDDRDVQVGDYLNLVEWDPKRKEETGRDIWRKVTYVLRDAQGFGLMDGYAIFGLVNTCAPTNKETASEESPGEGYRWLTEEEMGTVGLPGVQWRFASETEEWTDFGGRDALNPPNKSLWWKECDWRIPITPSEPVTFPAVVPVVVEGVVQRGYCAYVNLPVESFWEGTKVYITDKDPRSLVGGSSGGGLSEAVSLPVLRKEGDENV